ncbi:MAG: YtxH domain-containing protein [Nonlabens sp.]|nr:YtxH domain-containing protein [Nonlabens sp.]
MNNSSKTILGVLAGVAVGAAVGLLYAPESGEDTRKKLKKNALKAKESAAAYAQDKYERASVKAESFRGTVAERIDSALETASYKADDVIVALEDKLAQLKEKNAAFHNKTKPTV